VLITLREEIREKIMKNNVDYKASVDLHCRLMTFNVSDYVMIRMRPERFPEIICAKRRTISNPQEDQFKCLCGGSPTKFWHQLHF